MKAWRECIISDPEIMLGKPVVVGTRITVEHILEKMACGETIEEIVEEHPRLTAESVRIALAFAAETMRAATLHIASEVAD